MKDSRSKHVLIFNFIILLIWGLVSLYSASTGISFKYFNNSTYFISHQLIYGLGFGILGFLIIYKSKPEFLKKISVISLALSFILLLLVKTDAFGFEANGAHRWIKYGPIFFQPSEIAKFSIILYLSHWISEKKDKINNLPKGILPPLLIILTFCGLILWQPDMGTMLVFAGIGILMFFLAGVRYKYFMFLFIFLIVSIFVLIKLEPYRLERIKTFTNASADRYGSGYHITQALIGTGSGRIWGLGYGMSEQKKSLLPEVLGDSIFSVVAEEMGFVRTVSITFLFLSFITLAIRRTLRFKDTFLKMASFGVIFWISTQTVLNIGSILSILPLTGVPLPFFSYGSSSYVVLLSATAFLFKE